LCFPDNEKVSRQKTAISKPAIQPPPQSTVMVDEEVKADRSMYLLILVTNTDIIKPRGALCVFPHAKIEITSSKGVHCMR